MRLVSNILPYISKAPKSHFGTARLASNNLGCITKVTKSQFHRRDWPQTASPIHARPRNPSLAGETGLKQCGLYRQGPKIRPSWARLASNGLTYIGKAPKSHSRRRDWLQTAFTIYIRPRNPSLANETGLKQPLLYRQGPEIPVLPVGLASNSLCYTGNIPKSQSRRRDWPEAASRIYARPQNPSLTGETGLQQHLFCRQDPEIGVSPATRASTSLSNTSKNRKS